MKISFANQEITPEAGLIIAGYGPDDVSVGVHDPLYLNLLLLDDGENKALILGYDLLGIDRKYVEIIREKCASALGIDESWVILTCTHTHSGPQTRTLSEKCHADESYMERLVEWTLEAVQDLPESIEVETFFYSVNCDVNLNRRVILPEVICKFLPHFKELLPQADGVCDKELGMLFFRANRKPVYSVVNYAAHPLTSHAPGRASFLFSADYPGVIRRVLKEETGGDSMFVSGACGNMFPKNYETGFGGVEKMGRQIADDVMISMANAFRQPNRFLLNNLKLKSAIVPVCLKTSEAAREKGIVGNEVNWELQLLAMGKDICFIGVPGELLAELGLEMKWHSPFRRTYIMYNSTAYGRYISHGNAFVSGGYEAGASFLDPAESLKLVNAAVDAMNKLIKEFS